MKLKLDKKHENRIEFVAEDLSSSLANLVRRYAMMHVPVLAIDTVTFYDNTSAFWDEYLSHRIGLIPIKTPDKTPPDTEVVFTLDAEGPRIAYSSDMASSDNEIVTVKRIPIATLGAGQRLRLEGKAVVGTAARHAKFQAGLVGYGVEEKSMKLFVESFYQMEPYEVIARACDVLLADVDSVKEALSGEKPKKKAGAKKKMAAKKKAKKEDGSEENEEDPEEKEAPSEEKSEE